MEFALVVAIFVLGAVAGGLIVAAWTSDRQPRGAELHSYGNDIESRSRRLQ